MVLSTTSAAVVCSYLVVCYFWFALPPLPSALTAAAQENEAEEVLVRI